MTATTSGGGALIGAALVSSGLDLNGDGLLTLILVLAVPFLIWAIATEDWSRVVPVVLLFASGAHAQYVPTTERFTYADVSLGSTSKLIHPVTGDVCDQRCLFLRVEKRAFDAWPMLIRFLRTLPNHETILKSQLNATAGLPMVFSEIHFENSCQGIVCVKADGTRPPDKTGQWNFGPDYDWIGNVQPKTREACAFILKGATAQKLPIPDDIRTFCDYDGAVARNRPTQLAGPCKPDGWCTGGKKRCTTDAQCKYDSALKLRGVLTTKGTCAPLTAEQTFRLDETMRIHHENGEHRKTTGQPKPGGAAALMAAHAALEATARDADELTRFTIPAFPQTIDTSRPKAELDALLDQVDGEHHAWGGSIKTCHRIPALGKAAIWTHGMLHLRGHVMLSLNGGPALALRSTCADPLLDACPNVPFPPAGFYEASL